jgi:hypothetical protein
VTDRVHHGDGLPKPRTSSSRTTPRAIFPTGCSTGSTAASDCVSRCRPPSVAERL